PSRQELLISMQRRNSQQPEVEPDWRHLAQPSSLSPCRAFCFLPSRRYCCSPALITPERVNLTGRRPKKAWLPRFSLATVFCWRMAESCAWRECDFPVLRSVTTTRNLGGVKRLPGKLWRRVCRRAPA